MMRRRKQWRHCRCMLQELPMPVLLTSPLSAASAAAAAACALVAAASVVVSVVMRASIAAGFAAPIPRRREPPL
jgi:hypothetical protein